MSPASSQSRQAFGALASGTPENLREGGQTLIGVEQIHDMHSIAEMGLDNRVVITSPVGQRDHYGPPSFCR